MLRKHSKYGFLSFSVALCGAVWHDLAQFGKTAMALPWVSKQVYVFGIAFSGSRAKTLMKKIEG